LKDEDPRSGRHSYTVIVELDTGDRAISSPIWIKR